jgi:hypothetical protein
MRAVFSRHRVAGVYRNGTIAGRRGLGVFSKQVGRPTVFVARQHPKLSKSGVISLAPHATKSHTTDLFQQKRGGATRQA